MNRRRRSSPGRRFRHLDRLVRGDRDDDGPAVAGAGRRRVGDRSGRHPSVGAESPSDVGDHGLLRGGVAARAGEHGVAGTVAIAGADVIVGGQGTDSASAARSSSEQALAPRSTARSCASPPSTAEAGSRTATVATDPVSTRRCRRGCPPPLRTPRRRHRPPSGNGDGKDGGQDQCRADPPGHGTCRLISRHGVARYKPSRWPLILPTDSTSHPMAGPESDGWARVRGLGPS